MFLSGVLRSTLPLLIATAFANGVIAVAAEQTVTPMPSSECATLAQKMSQSIGIKLAVNVGEPDLPDIHGNACLMSGRATGLKLDFGEAQKRLEAVLSDWTPVLEFAADAPGSTQQGFSKASQRVVYQLTNEPPRGTCKNVVFASCKVPLRRWTWSLKVAAFSSSGT